MAKAKDSSSATNDSNKSASDNGIRVGIKDWWTKSKYAYLNQPAIESSADPPKRRTSTFVPNCFAYTPAPLYPTSVGVFYTS
ncbi:hypothetical protein C1H46_028681 [Malus baccata]|uniref:Uncharacterized protein n=1 Tax=Malus baccata TaxID=106549 RepID=A0A540LH13_MALBA|nr:hypothetical protein C1H46_028681 [Malus baccata]